MTVATVFTHRSSEKTRPALDILLEVARSVGATLRFDPGEAAKHSLEERTGLVIGEAPNDGVDICFALGGDGTILHALRSYVGSGVPVFAVNFGEIGFLATVDREAARDGFVRAFAHEFEVMRLPGIRVDVGGHSWTAINDVSVQRQAGGRVAALSYSIGAAEVGRVRCDGLVVATPAGSTGYNLANGGPVMAWGVEGMCVSFIAPHSLTARALVVAPGDTLTIRNQSPEETVDIEIDGRPVMSLLPSEGFEVKFMDNQALLAQVEGANFYQRLRDKFGRLASSP
jgi:NAD+ kinase